MNDTPPPTDDLVAVFHTADPGLLPLAELALRDAEIEYVVQRAAMRVPALRDMRTDFSNPTDVSEIIVRAEDAARARDLLADLGSAERLAGTPALEPTPAEWQAEGPPPILFSDLDAGVELGRVSEPQLQVIIDALEEDAGTSQAYYLSGPTLDVLQDAGLDPGLAGMLRHALGDREGFLLRWTKVEE